LDRSLYLFARGKGLNLWPFARQLDRKFAGDVVMAYGCLPD
jgi:hypothetical protein